MKKNRVSFLLMFIYIVGLFFPLSTFAEGNSQMNLEGFSFEVILPENQHNHEVTYFDLMMNPGQKQTVKIKMNNSSDEEIQISVKMNGAKTNSNGVIEYGPNQLENDASLKHDFIDIVKGPKEVKIPAKSSIMAEFNISMPEATIEGYISGGIQLEQLNAEGVKKETETGMVVNKFAYLVGMLLSEKDTTAIKPDMKLNKVHPELQNYRNAVFVNFSNIMPVYTEDMTVDVQLMKKGSAEVLYNTKKSNMRMAPNSMINFPISMNGEKMVPGDYEAKILVTTAAGEKWSWEEPFKITKEEADKFNSEDLSLVQDRKIDWKLIGMFVGGLLVIFGVVFLIVHSVNKKKKEKLRKKKNRKKKKER
ncbi:DUF916 and DUF3324 domain-containing protein [Enterococcus rivorum]|uniref:Uncharacterized protein n=1 Tax=Enterococcus rivorum TaxID=762845 RepID=A0A1E5KSP2_9ENTE|nr:DUF916 and DUF3324 domain-containing protein [Enterococcus rivorum]MBP2098180.1 hypothetical protein [Enterococcus rivorum]OEH80897.1 hypothetical protein BCR26_06610 [Enterococcus rivorum]